MVLQYGVIWCDAPLSAPSVGRGWVVIILNARGLELGLQLCAVPAKGPDDVCGEKRGGLRHSSFQCPISEQFAHPGVLFPFSNFCCTQLPLLRRQVLKKHKPMIGTVQMYSKWTMVHYMRKWAQPWAWLTNLEDCSNFYAHLGWAANTKWSY